MEQRPHVLGCGFRRRVRPNRPGRERVTIRGPMDALGVHQRRGFGFHEDVCQRHALSFWKWQGQRDRRNRAHEPRRFWLRGCGLLRRHFGLPHLACGPHRRGHPVLEPCGRAGWFAGSPWNRPLCRGVEHGRREWRSHRPGCPRWMVARRCSSSAVWSARGVLGSCGFGCPSCLGVGRRR